MNDDTRLRDGAAPRGEVGQRPPRSGDAHATAAGDGPGAVPSPATGVYAALDLGTNNCRLLIACPTGDGFRVVDSFSRIIRLGEGISATGCISDAAIERAIAALSICRDKIQSKKAKRLRLIATEACRAAANADGFRDRVAAETGIQLEVIDRETEAALAVIGCSPLLDPQGRGAILFDIGGGSTELVRIERDPDEPDATPRIKAWMSIPLGVVTLAEHFGGKDVTRGILCADGGRGRAARGAVRGRARRRFDGHASARHLRHGDDAGRRASQSGALRSPPDRRRLAERCRCHAPSSRGCSA